MNQPIKQHLLEVKHTIIIILNNNNLLISDKGRLLYLMIEFHNELFSFFVSPSLDMSSRYTDNNYSGTTNLNDLRPTSATSSVRSQDSGVAQSDPKTSIDCSAKSESSPKVSLNNSNNHYLTNNNPSIMNGTYRLTSSHSHQHLYTQQQQQQGFDTNSEQIHEKLQLLNTQRLKVLRQSTKTFIVN